VENKMSVYNSRNLRSHYNREAIRYDQLRYLSKWGSFFENWRNTFYWNLLESENRAQPLLILDAATGTGSLAIFLKNTSHKIIGLDISEEMIRRAKEKASNLPGPSIAWCQADALLLPFLDKTFDCIYSVNFLHLIEPNKQMIFIRELERILKPQGILIINLTSAFFALGFGLLRRLFRNLGRKRETFANCPFTLRRLFSDSVIEKTRGFNFPGSRRFFHLGFNPAGIIFYNRVAGKIPLIKYSGYQILVRVRKVNA
jgi:ubiquinone/menaquinone biosynthesis C-methylase UbiE